eukprot:3737378-Amphidinium_carterae.1
MATLPGQHAASSKRSKRDRTTLRVRSQAAQLESNSCILCCKQCCHNCAALLIGAELNEVRQSGQLAETDAQFRMHSLPT